MDHRLPRTPSVRPRTGVRLLVATALVAATGVASKPAQAAGDAPPARFTVANRSGYAIREVYACPPRAATWGANLIEGRVLAPSRDVDVVLSGGCAVYDLRFVADDGIEFLEEEVPFCGDDAEQSAAASRLGPADDVREVVTLGRDDLVKSRRPSGGPDAAGPRPARSAGRPR